MSQLFPVFLKLDGRKVVVVGGGPVAASKIGGLRATRARIVVVAPSIRPEILAAGVETRRRPFRAADLEGAWFVVAAAPATVNRAVARAAERRGIFVNAVDDPPNATAYLGGVLRRNDLTVSISTSGRAPALAGLVREGLEAMLPENADLERWFTEADDLKRRWRSTGVPMHERRPELLAVLTRLYAGDDTAANTPEESRR